MLWSGQAGFPRVHPEEPGIEKARIFEHGTRFDKVLLVARCVCIRSCKLFIGEERDTLATFAQVPPELVQISCFGKTSSHADYGNASLIVGLVVHTVAV